MKVVTIKKERFQEAAEVLTEIFKEKKYYEQIFFKNRLKKVNSMFRLLLDIYREHTIVGVENDNKLMGIAVVEEPGKLKLISTLWKICKFSFKAGIFDTIRLMTFTQSAGSYFENDDYNVLVYVGVLQKYRGCGVGKVLLNEVEKGGPVKLVTLSEVNVRFYKKHGYEQKKEFTVHGMNCWMFVKDKFD